MEQSINEFNDVNTQVKAETSFANHEGMLNAIKEGRTICFALLTIVILLSAVIISSSFKLIIVERMPVIGTFFSQGATKKNIIFVLLTESSLFGILGGVLAFLIGVGAIYAASYFLSQHKDYGVVANPQIPAYYFALTVIFGVLLSVLSSILPIIQIRKLSVKDVILGASNTNMRIGSKKLLAGLMFIILGIIVRFINIDGMISLSSILLILGIAFAFPKLIDIVVTFIYQYLKDKTPIVALALNNIRTSKELLNNITLILIASLSVISINSVGDGVKAAMTDGFNRNNFQIQITIPSNTVNIADTIISQKLNSSEIVQSSLQKLKVFTGQQDGVAFQIAGVDSKKYLSYDGYVDWDVSDNKRIYNEFKDSKEPKIIISKSLAKAIKVQEGEKLKLNINNIEKDIEIAGTVDMKMLYGGYVVLIDNEVLEKEFNYIGTNNIVLQTIGEEDTVRNQLRNLLQDYNVKVITFKELERANLAENEKTIAGFGVFSLIAVIVASFGVLNNTRISYLNSKRNIALLHAIGLNRIQKNKLLIYQSIFVMFWVIILLIPCSWAMVTMTKDLLGLLGGLDDQTSGSIIINGKDISKLEEHEKAQMKRKDVGFVFQFHNLVPNLSVEDNILLPILLDGRKVKNYKEEMKTILDLIELSNKRKSTPRELSGGQQQRVAIARALLFQPEIILADEPIGNLDSKNGIKIMELFRNINKEYGKTIIQVTHSEASAQYGDLIINLKDGVIMSESRVRQI
ncbi:hypothetical protein uth001_00630 [Clostridium butyricum]|nr:ATP-binding cassette domain-containing protein [Clostridium butyricum]POO87326.1 hypothetical protein C1H59_06240 [Clostridium sp. 3-3]RSC94689.1 ATP-binding cassette domain-containing protein [Clostridium butyricum]